MTSTRTETDSFGPLEVPADKYWGAQTQRSILNFPIGWEKQPVMIIRALGAIKQAAAMVNMAQGKLDREIGARSKSECHEGRGTLHRAFSIFVFNDANELLLQQRSAGKPLWPNYWSNTCCSHPRVGETMEVAVARRLAPDDQHCSQPGVLSGPYGSNAGINSSGSNIFINAAIQYWEYTDTDSGALDRGVELYVCIVAERTTHFPEYVGKRII